MRATQPIEFNRFAGQTVAEHVAGQPAISAERHIVYATYIDEPVVLLDQPHAMRARYYYHANSLYSVAVLTDGLGDSVECYAYSGYGNTSILETDGSIRSSSFINNACGLTGQRFDPESGFYEYRSRMYSSNLGRFVNRDPLTFFDGLNLYEYVKSQPLHNVDPMGTTCKAVLVGCPNGQIPTNGSCSDITKEQYGESHYSFWGLWWFGWRVGGFHEVGASATDGSVEIWGDEWGQLSRATPANSQWTHSLYAMGTARSIANCTIGCTRNSNGDCFAYVACGDSNNPDSGGYGIGFTGKHVKSSDYNYWHTAVSYSYSYNGPVVTVGYSAQASFSMDQPSTNVDVRVPLPHGGGSTGGAGLSFPAGKFTNSLQSTGSFSWKCKCNDTHKRVMPSVP